MKNYYSYKEAKGLLKSIEKWEALLFFHKITPIISFPSPDLEKFSFHGEMVTKSLI